MDRAEKFRLWARLFGRSLSLETSPQPKARRLSRVATPAGLPAANPATALLHRSCLVRSEGRGAKHGQGVEAEGGKAGPRGLAALPALLSCTLGPISFGASPCQSTFEIAVDRHRLVDAIK